MRSHIALTQYARGFMPGQGAPSMRESLGSMAGAGLGVGLVMVLSAFWLGSPLFVVAALGASSILVFCLPASPLAQPWAVIAGYLVCSVSGVVAAKSGLALPLEGGLAVALAAMGMMLARCLHPPGGAVALFAVVGGEPVRALGFGYVLEPVLLNAALLVAVALIVNNLMPGRRYPHAPAPAHAHPTGFTGDDLRMALREYDHPLAVGGDELDEILDLAEGHAKRRREGSRKVSRTV